MFNVNVDNVLYGNPFKKLDIMYHDVVSKNDDESAKSYYDYYSTLPLSVILSASELIFRESRYGIKYFTDIIGKDFVPYYIYAEQYEKLQNFVNSVNDFSDEEKRDYDMALSMLRYKIEATEKVMAPFSIKFAATSCYGKGCEPLDINLMNMLHNTRYESFDDEFEFDNKLLDTIDEIIKTGLGFILYGPDIFSRIPLDSLAMTKLKEYFKADCEGYVDFTTTVYSVILLKLFFQDTMYKELIDHNRNKRFREVIYKWASTDVKCLIDKVLCSPEEKQVKCTNEIICSNENVLESVFKAMDMIDAMEETNPLRDGRLSVRKCIYDYYAECLSTILINGHDFDINGDSVFGECGSVLHELTKSDLYSERCLDELGESYGNYCEFTKDDYRAIEEEATHYFESMDDTEDDEDSTDTDNSSDSSDPEDAPSKKLGFKSRLTNKALDVDKKAREVENKIDKNTTATKKLIKATMAVPNHIRKNIDDATNEVRNAKVNKLQRKLLNDGYRASWWNKIKTAIKYRMVGSVSALMVPIYWLLRKAEKGKNKRLKDEVISNMQLEIDILKDKYTDAENEHNAEAKEQIRRQIHKMEKELKRVKYNAKALS